MATKGNKVVSMGPGSRPVTLAHALLEHHEKIDSLVVTVNWKTGETQTFNTEMTNALLVWSVRHAVAAAEDNAFRDD